MEELDEMFTSDHEGDGSSSAQPASSLFDNFFAHEHTPSLSGAYEDDDEEESPLSIIEGEEEDALQEEFDYEENPPTSAALLSRTLSQIVVQSSQPGRKSYQLSSEEKELIRARQKTRLAASPLSSTSLAEDFKRQAEENPGHSDKAIEDVMESSLVPASSSLPQQQRQKPSRSKKMKIKKVVLPAKESNADDGAVQKALVTVHAMQSAKRERLKVPIEDLKSSTVVRPVDRAHVAKLSNALRDGHLRPEDLVLFAYEGSDRKVYVTGGVHRLAAMKLVNVMKPGTFTEVEVDIVEGGEMFAVVQSLASSRKLSFTFLVKAFLVRRLLSYYGLKKVSVRHIKDFLSASGFFSCCDRMISVANSDALDDLHTYRGVQGFDNENVVVAFKAAHGRDRSKAISVLADCLRDKKNVKETCAALFAVAPSRKRDRRDVFEGVTVEGLEEDEMEEINQEMEDNDVLAKKVREKVRPRNGGTESMGAPKLKKKIAIAKTELRHEQNRPIPASSFLASSPAKIVLCSEPGFFSTALKSRRDILVMCVHQHNLPDSSGTLILRTSRQWRFEKNALNRYAASFCVALKIDGVVLSEVQLADFIGASRSGELYPKDIALMFLKFSATPIIDIHFASLDPGLTNVIRDVASNTKTRVTYEHNSVDVDLLSYHFE